MASRFDVILQGGGQIVLAFRDDKIRPEEIGAFMEAARRHIDSGLPIAVMSGVGQIFDNRPVNEQNLTKITTIDRSSGKYHTRYIEVQENGNERVLVDERCQADQSGRYDVVEQVGENADRNALCYYCYPPIEVERGPTAGPI